VSGSDPNFGSVNLQALEQIVASFLQSSNLLNQTLPLTQPGPEELEDLDWTELAGGVILGPSHLYGTNTILTGIMVYSAVCLYSPILCFQQLMGATIGTLMGRSTGLKVRYSREPRIFPPLILLISISRAWSSFRSNLFPHLQWGVGI
jgi:hypothetical protein